MSKQQCEICGQMKSQQEMSKSYKHRCKECVARLTRIERKAAKQKAENLAEILEGTGYEVVSPAVLRTHNRHSRHAGNTLQRPISEFSRSLQWGHRERRGKICPQYHRQTPRRDR